jgi:hypothetical protein
MFLKHNEEHEDVKTVQEAFSVVRKEQQDERIKKIETEDGDCIGDKAFDNDYAD